MKVRHISGLELEVTDDRCGYWRTTGGSLILGTDRDWQLVPEEEWEDVTSLYGVEGVVRQSITLYSNEHMKFIDGIHNGPAIIVERRKE